MQKGGIIGVNFIRHLPLNLLNSNSPQNRLYVEKGTILTGKRCKRNIEEKAMKAAPESRRFLFRREEHEFQRFTCLREVRINSLIGDYSHLRISSSAVKDQKASAPLRLLTFDCWSRAAIALFLRSFVGDRHATKRIMNENKRKKKKKRKEERGATRGAPESRRFPFWARRTWASCAPRPPWLRRRGAWRTRSRPRPSPSRRSPAGRRPRCSATPTATSSSLASSHFLLNLSTSFPYCHAFRRFSLILHSSNASFLITFCGFPPFTHLFSGPALKQAVFTMAKNNKRTSALLFASIN